MTLVSNESLPKLFSLGRRSYLPPIADIWGKNLPVFSQHWPGPAAGPHCEVVMRSRWAKHFHFIDH